MYEVKRTSLFFGLWIRVIAQSWFFNSMFIDDRLWGLGKRSAIARMAVMLARAVYKDNALGAQNGRFDAARRLAFDQETTGTGVCIGNAVVE
jgi:hypothetical protein